jgi:hypothetical protein
MRHFVASSLLLHSLRFPCATLTTFFHLRLLSLPVLHLFVLVLVVLVVIFIVCEGLAVCRLGVASRGGVGSLGVISSATEWDD